MSFSLHIEDNLVTEVFLKADQVYSEGGCVTGMEF